jgi:hypothetical protein
VAVLSTETFAQDAAVARDNANLRIKGAEGHAALAEREALERVSRAEVHNFALLSSTGADIEDPVQKVILLEDELAVERRAWEAFEREHQELSEELTLLQT